MPKHLPALFLSLVLSIISLSTSAQAYINYSTYLGGSGNDSIIVSQIVNGENYILSSTTSSDFPVTNGSIYSGKKDGVLTKLSANGTVIYSTYLGSPGNDELYQIKIINGDVYVMGTTDSAGYPVTNGSSFSGKTDVVITRINSSGNIVFSTYFGGTDIEQLAYTSTLVENGELYIFGTTYSADFPVLNGLGSQGSNGKADVFITKLNSNGNVAYSTCLGGSETDNISAAQVQNGQVYITGNTNSVNFPATNGSHNNGLGDLFLTKLNTAGSIDYSVYMGGSNQEFVTALNVFNGQAYVTGFTGSANFPVTNGSVFNQSENFDGFYTRFNPNGSVGFSTFVGQDGFDFGTQMKIINGEAYILGVGKLDDVVLYVYKFYANDTLAYETKINSGDYSTTINGANSFEVINGEVCIAGIINSDIFPVTTQIKGTTGINGYFVKLNASGQINFSTFLGEMSWVDMKVDGSKIYIHGTTTSDTYPATNSSNPYGMKDNLVIVFNLDGSTSFAGYIGGSNNDMISIYQYKNYLQIDNGNIYITGKTYSNDYPVTNNITYKDNGDVFVTKLNFCPVNFGVVNDTLSPSTQTVCKFGVGETIIGTAIVIDPILYRNTLPEKQNNIEASYQWQIANSASGPWTNVQGSSKDYLPKAGGANQYYRRLAYTLQGCGIPVVDTSNIATVIVNNNTAPTLIAGGPFFTCPGSSVTLGGAPTVSGGSLPYASFGWDMGAGNVNNPVVSPNVSTIYTVSVTDALGCKQLDQALVNVQKADAGADKSNCAGNPVRIGTSAIAGLPGVVYSWSPATELSDATIAQPFANPVDPATYTLTLTLPKSGGGTCTTTDTVTVTPIAAPTTIDFAGPDAVICLGDSIILGKEAEAGFTYTWSPGNYLRNNFNSTTTFFPGNLLMPVPNPSNIYVTAQKGGCSFVDETEIAVIESKAGIKYCGPRIVGSPDRTPNINETYLWEKIVGSSNFTGAIDEPQVPVTGSIGGSSVYQLTVSYKGSSCVSTVEVPECDGCIVAIEPFAQYGCPSYDINNGNVSLNALSSFRDQDVIYKWSPAEGLSDSVGATVYLTDNTPRIYTVTATSIYDPLVNCSAQISVNDPAASKPIFEAKNIITCANRPTEIGQASVAGYTYEWEGNGLSSNFVSNPIATVEINTQYPVKITENTGCFVYDTASITIQNVVVNAGEDQVICNSGIIKLGTPALPNTKYLWIPPASPWQNGTDSTSAQPEVLVATSLTFVLVASSTTTGCSKIDFVNITVDDSPELTGAPDTTICLGQSVKIGSPAIFGVTYLWSPSTGLSDPNIAQPIATPTGNITYTLLATFPGGCSANDNVTVNVSDPAFTLPDVNYCPSSGAVALGATVPIDKTYYYWTPADLVTNPYIPNPSTLNPPPQSATTFTLTITNSDKCSAVRTMTIIPAQTAPIAGTSRTICLNKTTQLGSINNETSPNISYSWSPATNLSNASIANPIFTPTTTGSFTYTVTKTNSAITCVSTATVTITVDDVTLPIIVSPTVCENSCVQIGTPPLPGVNYTWSPTAGLSNAAIANPIACVQNNDITYTLTASNATCTDTANVIVAVNPVQAPLVIVPPVTVCIGTNNVSFNPIIIPTGSYDYQWNPDDGTLSNIDIVSPQIFLTSVGNRKYTLTVTNTITGCATSTVADLTVNACSFVSTIGDFVWFDIDKDGIQDAGEIGVPGVPVTLYNSLGFVLGTAVTDANGHYLIADIQAGTGYYIVFGHPAAYTFTLQNVGGVVFSNNSKPNSLGKTNTFNVIAGTDITNIDAGIIPIEGVPITLLSFTGLLHNEDVLLNWKTTAEYNNNHFVIERSSDGIHYTSIGTVKGNGTTTLTHTYTFTDVDPLNGTGFYRLQQVDDDGRNTYSNVVLINNIRNNKAIAITQNGNAMMVSFDKTQKGNTLFKLFASNGQLIKTLTAKDIVIQQISIAGFAAGIYHLQIVTGNNSYSKKIFIRR